MTQDEPAPTPVGEPAAGTPSAAVPGTTTSSGPSGSATGTLPPPVVPVAVPAPLPKAAAGVLVLGSVAAVGIVTAAALPIGPAGVGWLVSAVAAAVVTVAVARRLPMTPPAAAGSSTGLRSGLVRAAWAVAALALVAVGTVRAAHWLFVLCVPVAAVCGSLAVTHGRSRGRLTTDAVAVPYAAVECLPWVARGLAPLRRRVPDAARTARMALSVGVTFVLLVVFGALFTGADATFAKVLDAALPTVDGGTALIRTYLFALAGVGTAGALYLLTTRRPAQPRTARVAAARLRLAEWVLPVGLLVGLFVAFVVSQLVALFGGSDYVQRTGGLTYAEYARSGFWQLVTVTVLTLLVIGVALRWAPKSTAAERAWLRGLLSVLGGLTLVVVASALSRMWSYQQAYGFTVLRLFVGAVELWLGVVYLLVIGAVLTLRTRGVPRAIVATGVTALLVLAALSPDRFVAERNIARWRHTGIIDIDYLSKLSADAAPALSRLPEPLRSCVLAPLADRLRRGEGWRSWNVSRAAARELTASVPTGSTCVPTVKDVRAADPAPASMVEPYR